MRILVTCPPMLKQIETYRHLFVENGVELVAPDVVQVLTVKELKELVPTMDGWIIGDDPANEEVFTAGVKGKLKAAVKWGVGIDNVDFEACEKLGIPITNTPGMFGEEVSDVAIGILINLTRQIHVIDREVRKGNWIKPAGRSTTGKKVGILGFGDIGKSVGRKLKAFNMEVIAYDPFAESVHTIPLVNWPNEVDSLDYLIVTCALNQSTHQIINGEILKKMKSSSFLINVSRGPIIDEEALILALENNEIKGAGLDVFVEEPLALTSKLLQFENCFFGSHNGSNTIDAVDKTSYKAIGHLFDFLNIV